MKTCLTHNLNVYVPPVGHPLLVLRLASVRPLVLSSLNLLNHQRSVGVNSLPAIHRQHQTVPLPGHARYGIPRDRTLDDEIGARDPGDFGHLTNVRPPEDVHPGAVRRPPHAVVSHARVFAPVLRLYVADVHVADDVVLRGHVLAHQEPGVVGYGEAVQRPRELRRWVPVCDALEGDRGARLQGLLGEPVDELGTGVAHV